MNIIVIEKRINFFFNVASIESYNFYKDEVDDNSITIDNKPAFIHKNAILVINYKDKRISLKTKNYNVYLNPTNINFLKKNKKYY